MPSPELQIDIFVTNVKPGSELAPLSPSKLTSFSPHAKEDADLTPPHANFSSDSRRSSRSSFSEEGGDDSDLDLSYYIGAIHDEGELGHEEHVLDLTNFEGEDDTGLPGEAQFNLSIKNEGRTRRAVTRRASMALLAKQELIHKASQLEYEGMGGSSVQLVTKRTTLPAIDTTMGGRPSMSSGDASSPQSAGVDISTVRPSLDTVPEERPDSLGSVQSHSPLTPLRTPNSATPLIHAAHSPAPAPHGRTLSVSTLAHAAGPERFSVGRARTPVSPYAPRSASRLSQWTDTDSFAALVPRGAVERVRAQLRLDLDEGEVEDVGTVAEHARPGKPRLDRILADEVERAKGALAVACESPSPSSVWCTAFAETLAEF